MSNFNLNLITSKMMTHYPSYVYVMKLSTVFDKALTIQVLCTAVSLPVWYNKNIIIKH